MFFLNSDYFFLLSLNNSYYKFISMENLSDFRSLFSFHLDYFCFLSSTIIYGFISIQSLSYLHYFFYFFLFGFFLFTFSSANLLSIYFYSNYFLPSLCPFSSFFWIQLILTYIQLTICVTNWFLLRFFPIFILSF